MRSKAAIGHHPIHPMLVALPIGAFVTATIADVLYTARHAALWFDVARVSIAIGLLTAALAAVAGLIDYFGLPLSSAARRTATFHLLLNVGALVFYAISLVLRWQRPPLDPPGWGWAMTLSTLALAVLGLSGWLGGELVFKHRVGVVEDEPHGVRT
jgi:uncharacterized membrane protein